MFNLPFFTKTKRKEKSDFYMQAKNAAIAAKEEELVLQNKSYSNIHKKISEDLLSKGVSYIYLANDYSIRKEHENALIEEFMNEGFNVIPYYMFGKLSSLRVKVE